MKNRTGLGFLALTDLSRVAFADRISRVYDRQTQHVYVERMNVTGDAYSGISNSSIINRSILQGHPKKPKRSNTE
jgi:hypothetical protein